MQYLQTMGYFKTQRIPKEFQNAYAVSFSGGKYYSEGLQGIGINEKYGLNAKKMNASLQNDVDLGFHPIGTGTIKGVVDHELGHQIDHMLAIGARPKIQELYHNVGSKDKMQKQLSTYAYKGNDHDASTYREFIAEGWSEYRNNPNPRPLAQEIGQEIERGKRNGNSLN